MSFLRKAGLFAGALASSAVEAVNNVTDISSSTGENESSEGFDWSLFGKIAGGVAGGLCFLACCWKLCRPCCRPTPDEKRAALLHPGVDECLLGGILICHR